VEASQRLATVVAVGLVIVATFAVVYLFNEPTRRETAAEDKLQESAHRGIDIYVQNCLVCHGEDGLATGRQGVPLNTDANQVEGALWELREPEIRRTIERGGPTVMPAWAISDDGPLNDEQISDLVNMIHLGLWEEVHEAAVVYGGGQVPTPPPLPTPSDAPDDPDAAAGQQLANENGCLGCHTVDGSDGVGPTWQGLFGSEVPLEDGSTVTADEAYIHESIVNPGAQVHQGFAPTMPSFEGRLNDDQINQIIAYIQTLSE
jgi:mono/diheme cytochrome c family protein